MTDAIAVVLVVYAIGAAFGCVGTVGWAFSDHTDGLSPRAVMRALARHIGCSLIWPLSLPLFLARAWRSDSWSSNTGDPS